MKRFRGMGWVVFGILVIIGIVGCQMFDRDPSTSPTSPAGNVMEISNYAQMPDGSTVVTISGEAHQLNFVVSNQTTPYGQWIYVEVNLQRGLGKEPGVDQVWVPLQNVGFRFTGLPAVVTEIIAATKYNHESREYIEIGRYAVENGEVVIPVSYEDLVRCYGPSHYAVWFRAIGGQNEQGIQAGTVLELFGWLAEGQFVSLRKAIQFGTNPPPPPPPPPPDACQQQGFTRRICGTAETMFTYSWDGTNLTLLFVFPAPGFIWVMFGNATPGAINMCLIGDMAFPDGTVIVIPSGVAGAVANVTGSIPTPCIYY